MLSMAGMGTMIKPGIGTAVGAAAGAIMGLIENWNVLTETLDARLNRLKTTMRDAFKYGGCNTINGDNCSGPDTWLRPEDIWGKAVKIERGKHVITPDPIRGVRWAKFWHKVGKVYRLYSGYRAALVRRIKKLFA